MVHVTMRQYEAGLEDISIDVDDSAGAFSGVQRLQYVPEETPVIDVAQWLVHVGGTEVFGPVSAKQVAEAMKAGRLPTEASIQAVGEVFWTGLLDEPAVVFALKAI